MSSVECAISKGLSFKGIRRQWPRFSRDVSQIRDEEDGEKKLGLKTGQQMTGRCPDAIARLR